MLQDARQCDCRALRKISAIFVKYNRNNDQIKRCEIPVKTDLGRIVCFTPDPYYDVKSERYDWHYAIDILVYVSMKEKFSILTHWGEWRIYASVN